MLYADIYDAAGNRLGDGPVWALTGATISRALDGIGRVSINAIGSEERAADLLTNERRVRIYYQDRELVRGIVTSVTLSGGDGLDMRVQGVDALDELRRLTAGLARVYSQSTLRAVVDDLLSGTGWTATIDPAYEAVEVSARFDGESIYKALENLAVQTQLHLRYEGGTVVALSEFGGASGVVLMQGGGYEMPDDVAVIESIAVMREGKDLCNVVIPIGGGTGENAITLARSNRGAPYTITTITRGGVTLYALEDASSIARYGRIERAVAFPQIVPVSNSEPDIRAAANALYDVASTWLQRHSVVLEEYRVDARNVQQVILPGDKIRLRYRGLVETTLSQGTYLNIDADVWVMRVDEQLSGEGHRVALTLANVDRVREDVGQAVVGALEAIRVNNLRVQPAPTLATYVYRRELDPTYSAVIPVEFTNNVLYLNQCRVRIVTRPFRATAKAVNSENKTTEASGSHRHRMFITVPSAPPAAGDWYTALCYANEIGTVAAFFRVAVPGSTSSEYWTESGQDDHTHLLPELLIDYGIEDDTRTPIGLQMLINGVDVTGELGGPWAPHGGSTSFVVDVTRYLQSNLRRRHEIVLRCDDGQGEVEATVEMRMTVQPITV